MVFVDTIMSHSVTVRHPDHHEIRIPLTLHVDGGTLQTSPLAMTSLVGVLGTIGAEHKIEAIKLARSLFKISLLEAKLLVEQAQP